jgi:hypothetical protein
MSAMERHSEFELLLMIPPMVKQEYLAVPINNNVAALGNYIVGVYTGA